MASFTEFSKKRSHKRVVKSLFLPSDFLKDDRLVASVKRINITPADLLTTVSFLITIGGGNLNSVYLSHTYIRDYFNKITKAFSSTIRQKWPSSKNLLVHWDNKINAKFDGYLKKKLLLASVSGKEHKLLGVPS